MAVSDVNLQAPTMDAAGRPDARATGMGIPLSMTGTIRSPFYSIRPHDGVPALSCWLEYGESLGVYSVDGKTAVDTVAYIAGGDVGVANGQAGYVDRESMAFYSEEALEKRGLSDALAAVRAANHRYMLDATDFPLRLRLVAYGKLATMIYEMAPDGAVLAVSARGRTRRKTKRGRGYYRFEVVAVYVQFLRNIRWPNGGEDKIVHFDVEGLPDRIDPLATVTGMITEDPAYIPGRGGKDDILTLVVSASWDPDGFDAMVNLWAFGEAARFLAQRLQRRDMIHAVCTPYAQRHQGLPVTRFLIHELSILGQIVKWEF
jgi:hypothetical protein